jgi:hypothetical protein
VTVGENRVSLSHTDRTSGLRVARYHKSTIWVLRDNLIFFLLSAYSPTLRAIRNTLKPHSLVYNLHEKR